MSIKIEVVSAEVKTKTGVSAKSGKPYSIREQEAYAVTVGRDGAPHKYPQPIKVNLADDQQAYSAGVYTVAPESFYVDRFGGLSLGLVLKPLAASAPVSQPKAA